MFKKFNALILVLLLWLTLFRSANAIDLNNMDDEFDAEIKSTIEDKSSTTSKSDVTISNLSVVFNDDELPADSKSETTIIVWVYDNDDRLLSDEEIDLKVEITQNNDSTKWKIKDIKYSPEDNFFNVTYVAGSVEWYVTFKINATSKFSSDVTLEQWEELKLIAYNEPIVPVLEDVAVEEKNDTNKNVENILNTLEDKEIKSEDELKTETKSTEINIVETKVIDEYRIKITFDREIFLPDNPMSLVKIEKVSDKTDVAISNIALSEDKMALIVLTSDAMDKEPYMVSINEVIDGETKKKISVVNGELTVTGINEIIFIVLWLLAFSLIVLNRRKTSI